MKWTRIICVLGILIIPYKNIFAQVVVNEIAWMGTNISANAEWIELYNTSSDAIDLGGWTLAATDGAPNIPLSGTIDANGYFLLERTGDESVPTITADLIYTGALGNSGEDMWLKNSAGDAIDHVDATDGWPAGDNTTKETMQKSDHGWVTGEPTPKQPTNSSGTANNEDDTSSSGTSSLSREEIEYVHSDPMYSAKMIVPVFATRGVPVPLSVEVKEDGKRDMVQGKFEWSMGDGRMYTFTNNISFSHVYYYPGDYEIVMTYYATGLEEKPNSIHRQTIIIVDDAVVITGMTPDGGIMLENNTKKEIDLFEWKISNQENNYVFPKYTIVPKGKKLMIAPQTTGFSSLGNARVTLQNPLGKIVSNYPDDSKRERVSQVTRDENIQTEMPSITYPTVSSTQSVMSPQKQGSFYNLWNRYRWYIIATIIGIILILAYFFIDLYATRNTLASLHDDGEDEL